MSDLTFTSEEETHYDDKSVDLLSSVDDQNKGKETYQKFILQCQTGPFRAPYNAWLTSIDKLKLSAGSNYLDYCSGTGFHTVTVQRNHPEFNVFGFDISGNSVDVANKLANSVCDEKCLPQFKRMDAHVLDYQDEYFECIGNFGSLSSLDFDKVITEIYRVLKSDGYFISLETFGHNPISNLKRKVNVLFGKRTTWASANIFSEERLEQLIKMYSHVDVHYFSMMTLLFSALPIRFQWLLGLCEKIDSFLFLKMKWIRKYAFKVLVVARK